MQEFWSLFESCRLYSTLNSTFVATVDRQLGLLDPNDSVNRASKPWTGFGTSSASWRTWWSCTKVRGALYDMSVSPHWLSNWYAEWLRSAERRGNAETIQTMLSRYYSYYLEPLTTTTTYVTVRGQKRSSPVCCLFFPGMGAAKNAVVHAYVPAWPSNTVPLTRRM